MAVIGTFGSFTAARMGIYASQSALTVTGNNIANINTDGYTRQRLDLVALHSRGTARYANKMNLDMGYGVLTNGVSQLRDPYIDIRYRDEQAHMGASETWLDALQQMSLILDEVGDGDDFGIVERQFNEFLSELEQLNGDVGTPEYDTTARTSAQVLCNLLNSYAKALDRVEDNQIKRLKDDVTTVNSILTRIQELSVTIREGDIYGAKSLELRDERNVLIDELSKYMKIEVSYDLEKIDEFNSVERININVAGTGNPPIRLICGIYATQLAFSEKGDNGLDMAPMRNPNYNFDDPSLNKAGTKKYIAAVKNPDYDPTDPDSPKYVKAMLNPDYDATDPNSPRYIPYVEKNPDGTTNEYAYTDNPKIELTEEEEKKYDPNTDNPIAFAANNTKTGDENMGDNRAWLHLEPLVSAKGRVFRDAYGVDSARVELGDNTLQGGLQARREFIVGKGEFSSQMEINYDRDATTTRGVPYYRYSLDALAQKFARLFNEANQVNFEDVGKVFKTANDNNLPWSVDQKDWAPGTTTNTASQPYFVNNEGERIVLPNITWPRGNGTACEPHIIGEGDFKKFVELTKGLSEQEIHEQYQEQYDALYKAIEVLRQEGVLQPEYEYYNGGVLFSSTGDGNDMTGITAKNITISKSWSTGEVRLLNSKEPDEVIWNDDGTVREIIKHSTSDDNIAHMISLMNEKRDYFPRETVEGAGQAKRYFSGTFQERFADMNVILSVDKQTTTTLYDCYAINSLSLDNERQSVSGVDLNDEAMNMMVFQKSYSAACQLMTTLDSMLDRLINGTIR